MRFGGITYLINRVDHCIYSRIIANGKIGTVKVVIDRARKANNGN